jgi:zona occludens toxin
MADIHMCYSGLNGSGKSYGVVANVVIPSLEKGIAIATNLKFKDALYERFPNAVIEIFESGDLINDNGPYVEYLLQERFKKCSLFIFDEAQEYLGSNFTEKNFSPEATTFFNMLRHRKVKYEDCSRVSHAIYITPSADRIVKFVRGLIATTYLHKKLDAIGLSSMYRVDVYQGTVPVDTTKKALVTKNGKYKADNFQYYYSQTLGDDTEGDFDDSFGLEENVDGRKSLVKGIFIRSTFGIFMLVFGFIFLYSKLTSDDPFDLSTDESPSESSSPSIIPSGGYKSSSSELVLPDPKYFIVGSFKTPYGYKYIVSDSSGRQFNSSAFVDMGYLLDGIKPCHFRVLKDKGVFDVRCGFILTPESDTVSS